MPLLGLFLFAGLLWVVVGIWALIRRAKYPPAGAAAAAVARGAPLDPAEAGLDASTWCLDIGNGGQVPVWDIAGAGTGPITILLHDWGEAPLDMLGRARRLASEHRRIIVPCMRGHDGAPGACSLGPVEREDLARLLARLDDVVVLEGSGLGGHLADALGGDAHVTGVHATDAWVGRADGLRRILRARGYPLWPIAALAVLIWPEPGRESAGG